ncbi:38.7 kDa protein [Leucania separata nucleopolyhedrovirus]|uniref:38.7 kDa protein n=1 Tax=Leucania separata nucleopolyhedrovirus TaxID=1307956 RepID=Q0IKX0_NPVLS|nr:38.7 kDa protein [Leucania separata nucleopolyhedrovirus]AAR28913.1 38.7 kDa protein [Leucania separata nucleopolyhedrovirus]
MNAFSVLKKTLDKIIFRNNDPSKQTNTILPMASSLSSMLQRQNVIFGDAIDFVLRYTRHDRVCWFVGYDFARGIGLDDGLRALDEHVHQRYKCTLDKLLVSNEEISPLSLCAKDYARAASCVCIDMRGCLQLIERVRFDGKTEFTVWLMSNKTFASSSSSSSSEASEQSKDNSVLQNILDHVQELRRDNETNAKLNEQFKFKALERFEDFEKRLDELRTRLISSEHIEVLYDQLREHHHNRIGGGGGDGTERTTRRGEENFIFTARSSEECVVKLPRDTSKHPNLAVFLKSTADGNSTDITFVTGQRHYYQTRKRKMTAPGELVYDGVHPNPALEICRINEELNAKNYKINKRSKRNLVVDWPLDKTKCFIHEHIGRGANIV